MLLFICIVWHFILCQSVAIIINKISHFIINHFAHHHFLVIRYLKYKYGNLLKSNILFFSIVYERKKNKSKQKQTKAKQKNKSKQMGAFYSTSFVLISWPLAHWFGLIHCRLCCRFVCLYLSQRIEIIVHVCSRQQTSGQTVKICSARKIVQIHFHL